jgi:FAD/FMN-containing dehydrogenase
MDDVLALIEGYGYGLTNFPAIGALTVGGVLAVSAHGAGAPAVNEAFSSDHPLGTVSNLVRSITAVVWDETAGRYALRTFDRSHPHCSAFLTHLGRTVVTEVTLRVGSNQHIRCVSRTDIPGTELFAPPGEGSRTTFADLVNESGRVEVIWFPFSDNPWVKIWMVSPTKPLTSRQVDRPYNYPFTHDIPPEIAELADEIVTGNPQVTPLFGQTSAAFIQAGLVATQSTDIWGLSKNVLLWVKASTLRTHAFSQIVLTRRDNIQRVASELIAFYLDRLYAYEAQGQYPTNMPFEIRATAVDRADDTGVRSARPPTLSPARPRPDHPDWDVVLWPNVLAFPGTPHMFEFYRELERWMYANYTGDYAMVRPAWSGGSWAYTTQGAWADSTMLSSTIPDSFRAGYGGSEDWDWALARLDAYDPHRVFSNDFLDVLLP